MDDVLSPFLDIAQTFDDPGADVLAEAPWSTWSVDERREFLRLFVDSVLVSKASSSAGDRRWHWNGENLAIRWAGSAEPAKPAAKSRRRKKAK